MVEVAMEDDVFFADLSRQISLLIDEDDDVHVSHFSSFSSKEFPRMLAHPSLPSQYDLYQANHVREMSKGTGVFIPQSSNQRRRYKQQGKRAVVASYGGKNIKNKQANNPRARSNVTVNLTSTPDYPTNIHVYQDY